MAATSHPSRLAPTAPFYITTAINYANGPPHMGHAYEAIVADFLARYHRAYGRDVYFLTGSDEHGLKIAEAAAAQGMQPAALTDLNSARFQELNRLLHVSNDRYIRTTEPQHYAVVQDLWRRSAASGDIYLGKYKGWYNTREETFMTDTEAQKLGFLDPQTGKPLVQMEEESYFFRLTRHVPALLEHIRAHPDFVQPDAARELILSRLEGDEPRDLSVSRCNFSWGVPVPSNADHPDRPHVMYVWFDALPNYLTGVDYDAASYGESNKNKASKYWPANVHLIGKDIAYFHAVIWPCMLRSIGVPFPRQVFCHGFVLGPDGRKMGKSLGNAVDPHAVLGKYGADAFRYFLLRETTLGADLIFSERRLVSLFNADLLKSFGNLVHRATSLCGQFCGGEVSTALRLAHPELPFDAAEFADGFDQLLAEMSVLAAVELLVAKIHQTNQWMTQLAPWAVKGDDARRAAIVCTLLEVVFFLTHYLHPIVPEGASRVLADKFGMAPEPALRLSALSPRFDNLPLGTRVSVGKVLYQQLEFKLLPVQHVQLQVGRVASVQQHPSADRLYVLRVDLGVGSRQVVAGLVGSYTAEQLQGRAVVVLTNLKASKLRGQDSEGMLLVAKSVVEGQERVELLAPPEGAQVGAAVHAENAPPCIEGEIQIKDFKKVPLQVQQGRVVVDGLPLVTVGGNISSSAPDGSIIE